MELFKEDRYHTFLLPDEDKLDNLQAIFNRYGHHELHTFWIHVRSHFSYPVRIQGRRVDLPVDKYFPPVKGSVRKDNLSRACALLHCCPENIRLLLSILPKSYGKVIDKILRDGCVSYSELMRMGIKDILGRNTYYSWNDWSLGPSASLLIVRESTLEGEENENYHYGKDAYLFLPTAITGLYTEALIPQMADSSLVFCPAPSEGLKVLSAENEFLASFPLIQGVFRQSGIKLSGMKIASALAGNILSRTTIPEAIPEQFRKLMKISTGQYFLPSLVYSLEDQFSRSAQEHVRYAASFMTRVYAAYAYPAYLPHIKGFRSNVLQGGVKNEWMATLAGALKSSPDHWISIEALCNFIHGRTFSPWDVGYTISADQFRNMYLLNTITGEAVLPNNQGREIDKEMLRAMALTLYGLGAAEIAIDPSETTPESPCGMIRLVRLTPLGRYAFELDKEYHVENIESRTYFSLDDRRLIIRSTSGSNPYESLLTDTATPIGGGKFVMSAESFLKNCSTLADVDEKVKFFEDYVDNNPPQVWKDFFLTIRQRCKPLKPVKGSYLLLQLDPENKPLVDLILRDREIRPLVNVVEGHRVLVAKQDYEKLCKILKKHGYLL